MYTYFVLAETTRLIKIGKARNVQARLKALKSVSPDVLTLLAVVDGSVYPEDELHRRFDANRKHGEWFVPTPELLAFISKQGTTPVPTPRPKPPSFSKILTPGAIGNLILAYRKQAGLDQQTLADMARVSRQFLIQLEHGKPTAQIGKVFDVINALDIPLRAVTK